MLIKKRYNTDLIKERLKKANEISKIIQDASQKRMLNMRQTCNHKFKPISRDADERLTVWCEKCGVINEYEYNNGIICHILYYTPKIVINHGYEQMDNYKINVSRDEQGNEKWSLVWDDVTITASSSGELIEKIEAIGNSRQSIQDSINQKKFNQ